MVVVGDVFTADAVLAAIRAVTGPAGALLIVKTCTSDVLNVGLAAELARADGLQVASVVVDDDTVMVQRGDARRRGIAGTVLIHKVAGAAAAAGLPLDALQAEAHASIAAVGRRSRVAGRYACSRFSTGGARRARVC